MLDKVDLRALRNASSVCFDRLRNGDGGFHSYVRANLAADDERNNLGFDLARKIDCNDRFVNYEHYLSEEPRPCPDDNYTGYEMIHSARYNEEWSTILGLLKPGDEITLEWLRDTHGGEVTETGFHVDKLKLYVYRNGQTKYSFNVHTSICRDNSARMIRPAR